MKTSILILLLLFGFKCIVVGQNAFYDSRRIAELFRITESNCQGGATEKAACIQKQKTATRDLYGILVKYLPESLKNVPDLSKMNNYFKENNFLKDFLPEINQQSGDIANPDNFLHKGLSSIGDLDVTSIADGLARFLIKRGKEELNVAFFNQFKEFLVKHEECQVLFPNTVNLLGKIDSYKYATFLENLRDNFHTDLGNLIIHLNQVVDLPKYEKLIGSYSEIKLVINTANIVSELSQSGKNIMPDSVINQLAVLPWGGVSKNLENSLKFLNVISKSLRATSINETDDSVVPKSWVSLSDLNTHLFADSVTLRIFFGLLYQEVSIQNLTFYSKNQQTSIRIDSLLARQKDHVFRLSGLIQNFSILADDVQNSIEVIKSKKEKGTLSVEDYYTYINKAINIINYGFKLPVTLDILPDLKRDIIQDKYIEIARNSYNLYTNIYSKDYNSAVMNVCSILDSLLPGEAVTRLIPDVLKYGNFMASVVKAESPEDVQAAIEAAALPAGSSTIKKNSAINVSLNAYIGGYFARKVEQDKNLDGNSSKVGVTAPIGIAFSLGLGHFKNGSSLGALSLYATIIDVGAIAGFRLNDDSTALEQKVVLNDIFTPGGYLVYGIGLPFKFLPYVPLSIGYGWQYGSKLYNKENGKISISNSSRWRSNWFVAVDIPLANFWTKGFKK